MPIHTLILGTPVAGKLPLILFMLHVTGGHSGTICMQLAATRVQFLHTLAARTVQSRQFFWKYAATLPEQVFELKNEETIKKSENLRYKCMYVCMHGLIQSRETAPLRTYHDGFLCK
jgi:hypothetical protein